MSLTDDSRLYALLTLVARERSLQEEKFPDQHLPAGTRTPGDITAASLAKMTTDIAAKAGTLTWRHVLEEEVREAYAETDPALLLLELVQVAAVALRWAGEPGMLEAAMERAQEGAVGAQIRAVQQVMMADLQRGPIGTQP